MLPPTFSAQFNHNIESKSLSPRPRTAGASYLSIGTSQETGGTMRTVKRWVSGYCSEAEKCFAVGCRVFFTRLLLGRSWPWPEFVPGLAPCYDTLWCVACI